MADINKIKLPGNNNPFNIKDLISHVELTWSEYQQLPSTKNSDNVNYYITDKNEIYRNGIRYAGGSGASNLNELQDVTIDTPTSGQVLKWNGTEWENGNAGGGLSPHLIISTDSGLTVTATKGTTTITATETSEGIYECDVDEFGTYTLSDTENTKDVVIDTVTIYQISMTPPVPEGATVTPTDDIDTWIKCAGLENTNNYSSLAEVMADTELFDTLLRDSNACDYMARSTTWAGSADGLVPVMTSNTTPSGECVAFSSYTNLDAYKAFNGTYDASTNCHMSTANTANSDYYLGYKFPTATVVNKMNIVAMSIQATIYYDVAVYGGNDLSNLTKLSDNVKVQSASMVSQDVSFTNSTPYLYYVIKIVDSNGVSAHVTNTYALMTGEIQFYAEGITTNHDAMARVGKYDYCANKLSSNSTWAQAISNSAYMESVWDVSVPKMTDNTTPEGIVSASSIYSSSYPAYYAFNGNLGNGWGSGSTDANPWIQYEFPKPVVIKKASVYDLSALGSYIKTYKVEASNDGTNFTTLGKITYTTGQVWQSVLLDNNTAYKYYRFHFDSSESTTSQNWGNGTDFQFYGRADSTVYSPLVPVMTSNTTPSGTVSASSYYDSNYYPWKAFNESETYGWVPNSGGYFLVGDWLKYDFGISTYVDRVKASYKNTSTNDIYFKIQGSNDDAEWINLCDEQVIYGVANTTVSIEFNLPNPARYRYYRLYITTDSTTSKGQGLKLQYYVTTTATTKVHSCPNDTLYITDGVDTEVLCTTDSNGIGSIDWSEFDAGTYAIYSSVAKDPSNLSNDYKKIVRVTNTQYGHTTDAYIMPDVVKVTYWYGYDKNCELVSTGNDWSSSYTLRTDYVTFNTNNVDITEDGYHYWGGIGSKAPSLGRYVKAIMKTTTSGSTYTPHPRGGTSKSEATWSEGYTTETYANDTLVTADMTTEGLYYALIVDTRNYNKIRVSAMWIE